MDQSDRDFADEMIKRYGEERFYHSCKRTGGGLSSLKLHMAINDSELEESRMRLLSLGFTAGDMRQLKVDNDEPINESLCRIAFGFVRFYKEMGLRSHELPSSMNARMILCDQNRWTSGYVKLLNSFPDWNFEKVLP